MPAPPVRLLFLSPSRTASVQVLEPAFLGLDAAGAIAWRALFDDASDARERRDALAWADVVFLFRAFDPAALALLRRAHALGKRVIQCTDDDFARLPADTPLGRVHHNPENAAAYEALFREADLAWVFSEEMVARHRALAPRVVVGRLPSPLELLAAPGAPGAPGALDTRDTAESRLPREGEEPEVLTIGYAGRFVHEDDLEIAVRPLLRLLDAPGSRLAVELVDCMPAGLRGHPRVRWVPYFEELLDYYAHMARARWTIGLAPLADTPFHRGKTDNKYREYAAFGVPGIYSEVPVYARSVRDGETGLLTAHTEQGVAAALDRLLGDRELRARIRAAARADVAARYSLAAMQEQLLVETSRLIGRERPPDPDLLARALAAGSGALARRASGGADSPAASPTSAHSLSTARWSGAVRSPRAAHAAALARAVLEPPSGPARSAVRLRGTLRYSFVARRDGWCGVDVLVGTHGDRAGGELKLRVREPRGAIVREAATHLEGARDNAWVSLRFRPIAASAGRTYQLALHRARRRGGRPGRVSLHETGRRARSVVSRAIAVLGQLVPLGRPRATLHCRAWYADDAAAPRTP